jgi:hypothetical protein
LQRQVTRSTDKVGAAWDANSKCCQNQYHPARNFIGAGDLEISSADEIDDRKNLKDNMLPVGCNNRYKISSSVLCTLL